MHSVKYVPDLLFPYYNEHVHIYVDASFEEDTLLGNGWCHHCHLWQFRIFVGFLQRRASQWVHVESDKGWTSVRHSRVWDAGPVGRLGPVEPHLPQQEGGRLYRLYPADLVSREKVMEWEKTKRQPVDYSSLWEQAPIVRGWERGRIRDSHPHWQKKKLNEWSWVECTCLNQCITFHVEVSVQACAARVW